jgi:hypothetical protein
MFSDELAVTVRSFDGDHSYFVPREFVLGDPDHEGRVKVRVFNEGSVLWAILPNENQTALAVPHSDLAAA